MFPHGLFIDSRDHIWVADAFSASGKGAQVFEFDRDGHVLRTLGKAGVSVAGRDTFAEPCAVAVARDGTFYVADGHTEKRAIRLGSSNSTPRGGTSRNGEPAARPPDKLEVPHSLALDSRGRVFVADRWNNWRIEIFDPEGRLLSVWTQFGRPSGVYIDAHNTLYVTDSESRDRQGYGHHPGWKRGIRIGSARTGEVTAFIPDPEPNPEKLATSGGEGVWADPHGVVYAAEVTEQAIVRYVPKTSSSRGQ